MASPPLTHPIVSAGWPGMKPDRGPIGVDQPSRHSSGAGSGGRNVCGRALPARCCGPTDHAWRFVNCSCGKTDNGLPRHSGSVRGRPNCGRTLLSKRVMALILSPARVRTISPLACSTGACGSLIRTCADLGYRELSHTVASRFVSRTASFPTATATHQLWRFRVLLARNGFRFHPTMTATVLRPPADE